ncbi:MAG: hypothetical protein K2X66_01730, partial [Cyanobacteria bacterium]|nr:hypothetical protein [Cyanobacteriota bacterium]
MNLFKKHQHIAMSFLALLSSSIALVPGAYAQVNNAAGSNTLPTTQRTLPGQILNYNQQPENQHIDAQPTTDAPVKTDVENTQNLNADENIDPSLKKKILIKSINLEGSTILSKSEIKHFLAPYENKESSFIELKELADKITAAYREKGFITSRVFIPPQTIKDGVLSLKASEGMVGAVKLEQGYYFKDRAITNRVNLDPGDVFRVNRLRRSLLLINENPDMKVKATLKAGTDPGTTDVDLNVTERHYFHVSPYWDNLGRRLIGTQRFGLTMTNNNVSGFGDKMITSANISRRAFGVTNRYEVPLGRTGTRLGFDYGYNRLTIGKEFALLKVKGHANYYSPYLSHTFYTSDNFKVSMDLPLIFIDSKTSFLTQEQEDRTRLLQPALNLESYDKYGATYFRNEFGVGINLFGATTGHESFVSRAGAGSKFFRWTSYLTRTQRLPFGTYAVIRATAQLSPDKLVSAQQYQVGGAFTVRGYKEGRVIGDNAMLLSSEWRVPFFLAPKSLKIPFTNYVIRDNVQMVAFSDFGASWINRPSPGLKPNSFLYGIGCGVRARLTQYV